MHPEETNTISWDSQEHPGSRPFECSCGKTYKSYPALFVHIRNKHNGKVKLLFTQAPGPIKRPPNPEKRRGRPPVKNYGLLAEDNRNAHYPANPRNIQYKIQQPERSGVCSDSLGGLVTLMERLPE